MSNIIDYLQKILSARYGKDVRQSIHDSILQCYEDGRAGAIDLVARQRIETLESSALIRKIVDSLPTEDISTTTVYMIPSQQSSQDNIYDEYMYINESWEKIGSSAVDLTDYLKKDGDSSNNTVTFTSNDSGPDGEHAILSVDKLTTGEKFSSLMQKISRMFTNMRYILGLLGTHDITSESVKIGDGTITGALIALNDSFSKNTLDDMIDITSIMSEGTIYTFPSDGYLNVWSPKNGFIQMSINGKINLMLLSTSATYEQKSCVFVKKGMTVSYANGTLNSVRFFPLI